MEKTAEFDLEQSIQDWEKELLSSPVYTNTDIEELKSHLLDLYYDLQEQDLSKEEAFLIALTRMGRTIDWSSEFEETNKHILELKKMVLIVAGIFYYFFSYYVIRVVLVAVLLGSVIMGNNAVESVQKVKYLILMLLSFVLGNFIFLVLKKSNSTINKLKRIKLSSKRITRIFLLTVFLAIANHCTLPFTHKLIPDNIVRASYAMIISYFNYAYPFLILLGMLLIYIKLFKITEVPKD